ncbi:MAG: hypothetical protein MJ239_02430 [Bacilli bacterium]|nr:hypothetical protein [Bacilli bacterium]
MRRLISYSILCGAMLLGVAAAVAPTVKKMDSDLAFEGGKTLTFRLSDKETLAAEGGYNPGDNFYKLSDLSTETVDSIAGTMKTRLETWGVTEYDLKTVGTDTITVSFRANDDNTAEYGYIARYLSYSGGHIEMDASYDTADPKEGYAHDDLWQTMLEGRTARIEYIEQHGTSSFPVVVLPIGNEKENIESFKNLVKYCKDNTTEANEETGTPADNCSIVLWANRRETDFYNKAAENTNVATRILINMSAQNDACCWYASNDEDKEYPSLQLVPNSAATESEGAFTNATAKAAYDAARYLVNVLNADELKCNVTYLQATDINATVEPLVNLGEWFKTLSMSKTLIASVIALVVVAVILALFDRLLALSIVSTGAATTYLTLLIYILLGTQFSIGALVGLLLVAGLSTFGGIYYGAKLKDELYKGRTLKKAHVEAAKKTVLPVLDSSVVSVALGFFSYIFGGAICKGLGICLVAGGIVNLVMNLIVFRIENWLLCNDSTAASDFGKLLNVNKDKVPDLLKEEKQTYFGPYEKSDFSKSKGWVYGVVGAIMCAGIATMIAFGMTKGTVYNLSSKSESSVVYVEARSTQSDYNDNVIQKVSNLYVEDQKEGDPVNKTNYLYYLEINGQRANTLVSGVSVGTDTYNIYDEDDEATYYWYTFSINLKEHYALAEDNITFNTYNPADGALIATYEGYTLADGFDRFFEDVFAVNFDTDHLVVTPRNVINDVTTPDLGPIMLGNGIAIAVCFVYMALRYRPSRALAAAIAACAATYGSVAFFAFTRIATMPVVAVGSVGVAFFALIASIFVFGKEKEVIKDSREKDKRALAFRSESLKSASSRSAGELIVFTLIMAYLAIDFFGFGASSYSTIYLAMLIGIALATVMVLGIVPSMSIRFATWLSKVHFKMPKRKKKVGQLQAQKKSSEPEEATFIGIND